MRRHVLLKVVAVIEVVSGVVGPVWLPIAFAWAGFPKAGLLGLVVGIGYFLLSLFAGVMLWRDRPSGYGASVLAQCAQLIKVATPKFAIMIGLGGDLAALRIEHQTPVGVPYTSLTLHTQVGPYSVIEFARPPGAPRVFGVSIVSCVALFLLRKYRHPATGSDLPSGDAVPVPVDGALADKQPDWVLPFWLKIAVGLFALIVLSCGGLLFLSVLGR
jgi:hypothetical protein